VSSLPLYQAALMLHAIPLLGHVVNLGCASRLRTVEIALLADRLEGHWLGGRRVAPTAAPGPPTAPDTAPITDTASMTASITASITDTMAHPTPHLAPTLAPD
jgi:hypothetical protein